MAATDRGITAVSLADTDDELLGFLKSELPYQTYERDESGLASWLTGLFRLMQGGLPTAPLPVDARGTDFQQSVWKMLMAIPRGETWTYQRLAAALGRPTATRAAARACAMNPVAVIVPCHRVIGSDGALRGYRWGVDRKQRLLECEKN
jgi:AraC family transcriptional regulator of adaptative response/methylated-DNA-[protein]-cysteine methyltransferase